MSIKYYYPELEYFFYEYWKNFGESSIYDIKIPDVITDTDLISEYSFFELLFNNAYDKGEYLFTFEEKNLKYCSKNIRERLYNSSSMCKVYFISGLLSGETQMLDIFGIQGETEELLDLLLLYRTYGYCNVSSVDYDSLTKCISKLIYQYLDLMINNNYERIDTSIVQADNKDILCGLFELYLVNEAYRYTRDSQLYIENKDVILIPYRVRMWADEDTVTYNRYTADGIPYDTDNFYFFINGELIPRTVYDVILDDSSFTVDWNGSSVTVEVEDTLITDFYTEA